MIILMQCSMRLLACAGAEKQCPPTVPTGKALTCCNSLPACEKSFLTRKEYAICRSPPNNGLHFMPSGILTPLPR